jgi:hypothetical protein
VTEEQWSARNQRYLTAAVGEVCALLARHLGDDDAEADLSEARAILAASLESQDDPPALLALSDAFGLSTFERRVLVMCAALEFDGTFASLCARAQGEARRAHPTFGLALATLPHAHWSAVTPEGPLRRWRLIALGGGSPLTAAPLSIDEQVLHFLTGLVQPNPQFEGLLLPLDAHHEVAPSHRAAVTEIASLWAGGAPPLVHLRGTDEGTKRDVAAAAAKGLDARIQLLRATEIPEATTDRSTLARLWTREAMLTRSVLLVETGSQEGSLTRDAVTGFLRQVGGPVLVASRDPLGDLGCPVVQVFVDKPDPEERTTLWREALGEEADSINGQIEAVVSQFQLGTADIRAAAVAAVGLSRARSGSVGDALWEACRAQARPRLEDLAQRIEPRATWEELVLPEPQLELLRQMSAHVRQKLKVYQEWGFAAKSARGLGISALFSGPSGTGKTMAAEVLANELKLDLYRIDLSSVVSKYIGETEKNLRRVFDAAESGGAILLFDEADALFGKRSEVKDSRDRYANIEVGYLLQRMEAYMGLAVLTTNLRNNLDDAFERRIRFSVGFPFPDTAERRAIWARMMPDALPTEGLDLDKLARLKVAGGNIRNIAMNAAFLAADADSPVRMVHVLAAARAEYGKLDKTLTQAEVSGWA